ncbi:MAG: c-type cytochrome [Rubrivivax sp.]|jgi:cytochrome c553
MASKQAPTAALALAVGLALCGGPLAYAQAQPATANPATLAACAACHGPGGQSSNPTVPSLAAQPRTFLENQLVLIREGLRDVPVMKGVMAGVDDHEITVLARYFAAQPAQPLPGAVQPEKARAGAELSRRALCGGCHLPGYVGQNQVPRLAGQPEAYLLATMKMYRDKPEPGRDTLMSGPLAGMKDTELDSLAHYLAHHGK